MSLFSVMIAAAALGNAADEPAYAQSEALNAALAGLELSGETRTCLPTHRIDQIDPVDEFNWIVTTRGRDTYLVEVSRGCRSATRNFSYLQYRTNGQLCRNDMVDVIDRGSNFIQGSCGLGEYQELVPLADGQSDAAN